MAHANKKPISEPNIEEAFKRHSTIATKVKEDYNNVLREVGVDMKPSVFEPFDTILMENENTMLNKDVLIESVRIKMSQTLQKMNEIFFDRFDVGKKLITLEVLKEKFESYKGTNWNVNKLTPEERTRSIRMRFMDSSIRYMENQISAQENALKLALAKSRANRERIQNIQNERIKLHALMKQQAGYYKEMTPKLMELSKKIIEYEN